MLCPSPEFTTLTDLTVQIYMCFKHYTDYTTPTFIVQYRSVYEAGVRSLRSCRCAVVTDISRV